MKEKQKKVQNEKLKLAAESSDKNEKPIELEESYEVSPQKIQDPESPEMINDSIESIEDSPEMIQHTKPSQYTAKMTPKTLLADSPAFNLVEDVEDSFLELEKICENTLNLNNVSEHLTDLTCLDASMVAEQMKKKFSMNPEESRKSFLNDIEPPSFMSNLTMFSPKNSQFRKTTHENRPSTIMEVTELSTTTKSGASSYRTAEAASYEKSECYQTANEESWTSEIVTAKKRAFFDDSMDYTKDSLDMTQKAKPNITQMTQDSLNEQTGNFTAESTFENDENLSYNNSGEMNDTLEAVERLLAKGNLMNSPKKTPFAMSNPATPQTDLTPKQQNKPSPTPWSSIRNVAKTTTRLTPNNSPLIKFSPSGSSAVKSPMNFKLPKQPLSSSKMTPFSSTNSKKFQHIISPIARYINQTPELPLNANVHAQFGVGSRQHFNFRDSESFAKENKNILPTMGASLPMRVKTKTTTPVIFLNLFYLKRVKNFNSFSCRLSTALKRKFMVERKCKNSSHTQIQLLLFTKRIPLKPHLDYSSIILWQTILSSVM